MKKLASTVLAILFFLPLLSNEYIDNQYVYTEVSILGGQLHSSNIKNIISGDKYVWFGTTSGIDRQSGYEHKFWAIPASSPNSIAEDSDGHLWVASANGLFFFDDFANDFVSVPVPTTLGSRCRSLGDEVWVFNSNSVYIFGSGNPGSHRVFDLRLDSQVMDACMLTDSVILLATGSGLFIYDTVDGLLRPFSSVISPNPRLVKIIDDTVYSCNYGYGVWKYDKSGNYLGRIEGIGNDFVTDIILFDGCLWISTDGSGLAVYNPNGSEISFIHHIAGEETSFPANAFSVLSEDKNGGLWAGSVRYGAFHFHKRYIRTYSDTYPGKSGGLSEKCAVGLFRSDDGDCWIGTDGQGINRFSLSDRRFSHFAPTFGYSVPSLCGFDDSGKILASFFNKGFVLFDSKTYSVCDFVLKSEQEDQALFRDGLYPYLFRTRHDRIFILGNLMYVLNPLSGMVSELVSDDGKTQFQDGKVWYSDKFILVSLGNKLYINSYDDFVLHSLTSGNDEDTFSAIAYDDIFNRIWVSLKDEGLGYYTLANNNTVSGFNKVENIDLNGVSTLTADRKGRLWITSLGQLYLYEHESGRFKLFSVYDGFEWNEVITSCCTEVEDNIFYLAGTSGFVTVDTDIADDPSRASGTSVHVSEVNTSRKRYTFNSSDSRKKVLTIPARCKKINVLFSVEGLHMFERTLMRYTITGRTESTVTSSDMSLNLSSLAPGKYTVNAVCQGSAPASQKDDTLYIRILSPWYSSILFIVFLSVLLLSAVYFFFRLKKRSEVTVREISSEDRNFIRKLCEYVSLNMDKDLSAETLTRELGISRTLLFEKVKALTGNTLNEYIKYLRIERAQTLLKETDLSINEISDEVGFTYSRYFSSVFKQVTGQTPSQFKKSL